jgi:methyl-coenzyme M reductase subunit D
VELHCLVGAFYMELAVDDKDGLEATVEKIKAAFDETVTDGYTIDIGRYSKYRPSLHDYRSA